MKIGLVYDPVYLKHDTRLHIEKAKRLEAIMSHLEQTGLKGRLTAIEPRPATVEELSLVHQKEHISHIREVSQQGGGWLDPDTVMSSASYNAALYAAGGAIRATEAVLDGEVSSAFALVRPPGHHATPRRAMGFCLFNNVAVAAQHALVRYNPERVAVIDFDVHHGNGTQEAFYNSPRVLYISSHQYPHYPGTGGIDETGAGEGTGTTINIPLPAGCGDAEYGQVFTEIIMPAARRFQPQLILVSAGYDPHWADELAMTQVSVSGFIKMVRSIKDVADELCQGRMVFSLEGGYNLKALAASVKATFEVLLGDTDIEDPLGQPPRQPTPPGISHLLEGIKKIHNLS